MDPNAWEDTGKDAGFEGNHYKHHNHIEVLTAVLTKAQVCGM